MKTPARWRKLVRTTLWSLVALPTLAFSLYWTDQLAQPLWEVRIEGTDGLEFEGCVTVTDREFWNQRSVQAELAQQTVPQRRQFRAVEYSGWFNPVSGGGFMKVTILRDGEVVSAYEFEPGSTWPVGMQPSDLIGSNGLPTQGP